MTNASKVYLACSGPSSCPTGGGGGGTSTWRGYSLSSSSWSSVRSPAGAGASGSSSVWTSMRISTGEPSADATACSTRPRYRPSKRSLTSELGTVSASSRSSADVGRMPSNHVFQVASDTWVRNDSAQVLHSCPGSVTSAFASPTTTSSTTWSTPVGNLVVPNVRRTLGKEGAPPGRVLSAGGAR